MRKFKPRYFLINGKAYPDTAGIPTSPANRVLLRYVNAGNWQHSMGVLGGHQTVIAHDGHPMTYSPRVVAETFGPGQTTDAIVPVSGGHAGVETDGLRRQPAARQQQRRRLRRDDDVHHGRRNTGR